MSQIPIKKDKLREEAFTHRSYLNEHPEVDSHNERLEFLGDAVLELVVSKFLFHRFANKPEGWLTAIRSALVKTPTLAEAAAKLELGEKLKLSKGEEQGGGRKNATLLANTFEAVVGAIYLDSGYEVAQEFINKHLLAQIEHIIKNHLYKDPKSSLQEIIQAEAKPTPVYRVAKEVGPDHDKQFTVDVLVGQQKLGQGEGKSKQEAEQNAAKNALEDLRES